MKYFNLLLTVFFVSTWTFSSNAQSAVRREYFINKERTCFLAGAVVYNRVTETLSYNYICKTGSQGSTVNQPLREATEPLQNIVKKCPSPRCVFN